LNSVGISQASKDRRNPTKGFEQASSTNNGQYRSEVAGTVNFSWIKIKINRVFFSFSVVDVQNVHAEELLRASAQLLQNFKPNRGDASS